MLPWHKWTDTLLSIQFNQLFIHQGLASDEYMHQETSPSLVHYDVKSQSFNPGLQYPHLHGPVHTPDNNRWDTPPV